MVNTLLPLAKLMLRCGIGCSEFVAISKIVFVQAASEMHGVRGRPANISRIAATIGLSRKQVRRIRDEIYVARWTPDMEVTPVNTVLHYWHFDPEYSDGNGTPKPLAFEGPHSFATLVKKYAGDIPPGALRTTLIQAGAIKEEADQSLKVLERYFYPEHFDEDFIRSAAFALRNLGNTLVHNASIIGRRKDQMGATKARLERSAWTEWLSPESSAAFRMWVASEGARFVERADDWIGRNEIPKEERDRDTPKTTGVGVYYFEED
ncbi:MAG TPA: DUF6502 family protein [Gammaproteobacteria bacterium]|nr:DUF6502 family protein [Gammaproteobacteria bacterium]